MRSQRRRVIVALGLMTSLAVACGVAVEGGDEPEPGHGGVEDDGAGTSGDGAAAPPNGNGQRDAAGHDGGGGALEDAGDADGGADAGPDADAGPIADAGPDADAGPIADAGPDADAGPIDDAGPDAAVGIHPIGQYSSRGCQSLGGFGTVRPGEPASVLAFLEDLDGTGDIALTAEVTVTGSADGVTWTRTYSIVEDKPTQRVAKIQITHADFLASGAKPYGSGNTSFGARVVFRDHQGDTTTASCSGASGWRLGN